MLKIDELLVFRGKTRNYIFYKSQQITMQKTINRFWDWLFHPSIRWYHFPKGKAVWFRYPSPGSNINKQQVVDYKTPFENSDLNIRYKRPVDSLVRRSSYVYLGDSIGVKIVDKLRAAGLLELGNTTEEQIQQAKKKYLQKFGVPVEQKVFRNDANIELPEGTNRQSYRKAIQRQFKDHAELNRKTLNMPNTNRRFIQQPQTTCLVKIYVMQAGPHFQQTRIQIDYKLDIRAQQAARKGFIEIRKGERTFWKALDSSNDPKNIQRVQKATGDQQPNNFALNDTKIQFQKNEKGDVVDVHPKTKSV